MGFAFVRRVRILLQTHRQEGEGAYSCVRVCMEVYGSVIWRIEMSERVLVWSACCVYGPAKSIHSSSQPLNGKSAWWWWWGWGWRRQRWWSDDVVNIKLINNQVLQVAKVGFRCWHVSQPALTNWSCPSVRRSEVRVANGVLYLSLCCDAFFLLCCLYMRVVLSICVRFAVKCVCCIVVFLNSCVIS